MSFKARKALRSAREATSYVRPPVVISDSASEQHSMNISQPEGATNNAREHSTLESVRVHDRQVATDAEMRFDDGSPPRDDEGLASVVDSTAQSDLVTVKLPGDPYDHTGLYKELSTAVEVRRTREKGRGLWAKELIRAGEILLSARPQAHSLGTSHLQEYCTYCCSARTVATLKRCTKCKVISYCGAVCQTSDWTFHKHECDAIQRWSSSLPSERAPTDGAVLPPVPGEAVRCLARMLWMRKKHGSTSTFRKELDGMQSNSKALPASVTDTYVHLAHSLIRFLGVDDPEDLAKFEIGGVGELVDIISKFTTNTFTLTTSSLTPIGVCISPVAALINHDCSPNTSIVFPRSSSFASASQKPRAQPILHVVAFQNIEAGDEVLTSYIDTTLPKQQRQEELKSSYNFTCSCRLCKPSCADQINPDPREAMLCPQGCGGSYSIPSPNQTTSCCPMCHATSRDVESVSDAVRVGQDALEKATKLQFCNPTQAASITSNIIPLLLAAKFALSSHPLLALNRIHQSLLISALPAQPPSAALNEVIRVSARSVTGVQAVLEEGHPVRGIALAEFGKLLATDEPTDRQSSQERGQVFPPSGEARLHLAMETSQRALQELQRGFGKDNDGGEVGLEIRELVVNLEKELSVWRTRIREVLQDTIRAQKQVSNRKP